jgi:hypothetical protein
VDPNSRTNISSVSSLLFLAIPPKYKLTEFFSQGL